MFSWMTDRHKRAMNIIYQKPLYPDVWDEDEVRRGKDGQVPSSSPTTKPKLIISGKTKLRQDKLW